MIRLVPVVLVALTIPAALVAQHPLPRTHVARPTVPEITAGDLMTRLYVVADDSMQGRLAGALGDVKVTDYIAREIRRMGLAPAGEEGTYFQTIPLSIRTLDTTSTFAVAGKPLRLAADFLPSVRRAASADGLGIVYGGVVGDSTARIAPDQARGKLVVFDVRGPVSRSTFRTIPPAPGAAAVAVVALDSLPPPYRVFFLSPQRFLNDPTAQPDTATPAFLISRAAAAGLFAAPLTQLAPGDAGATASIHIRYAVTPVPEPARNVVGIIPGGDSALRGEYVAIGAHTDHIGLTARPLDHDSIRIWNHLVRPRGLDDAANRATPAQQTEADSLLAAFRAGHPGQDRPDSISNGADDDGSGTVVALEIAQRIAAMQVRPKRSILFVWHTAEEAGLLGSRWFTDHPTVPRDSIVAQLNMDMVGRGDATDQTGRTKGGTPLHGGPSYLMLVGSRRLSTELGDLVERVNREDHHDFTFDYSFDANGHPTNVYCRSDHYEYARWGIPIVFFTTGLQSDYHQVTDEPEYIDYPHMTRVAKFVADVATHVADLDHRPVVDHPKPDPHGSCRQ